MASTLLDINELFGVKDLIAVITGGGTGIGLMIAQALEANGAIVYIIGRREETLAAAAGTAKHGNIHAIQGDVTSKADLDRAVAHITTAHGYLNVVIANAGISGPSLRGLPESPTLAEFRKHVWAWDAQDLNETFAINVTATLNTAIAFVELLGKGNKRGNLKQKSQIIATSSIGGFNRNPLVGFAYGGSKAAVTHTVKQLSTYLGPFDIRANAIAPGIYPSEITEDITTKFAAGWPRSLIPEERAGDAQDMGGAILFLVSKAGAYINGNVLVTDGGRLGVNPATY